MEQILRGGPLDINICPTREQAKLVAAEACRLLNKYPQEIKDGEFPNHQTITATGLRYFPMSSVIELMSMRAIEEDFDFRRIRYVFQVDGQYRLRTEPTRSNRSRTSRGGYEIRVPGFLIGKGKSALVTLPADFLEANGFDELPPPPSSWGFSSVPPKVKKADKPVDTVPSKEQPPASTEVAKSHADAEAPSGFATKSTEGLKNTEHTAAETKRAKHTNIQDKDEDRDPEIHPATLAKLIDFITWKLFGMVGSLDPFAHAPRTLCVTGNYAPSANMSSFSRKGQQSLVGPFGGRPLFAVNHQKSHNLSISPWVRKSISGSVPSISLDGIKHSHMSQNTVKALAMESAYRVFYRTQDIKLLIQELFVSVDELGHFKSILNKESHCRCQDDAQKREESHYCMWCLRLVPCHTMVRHMDNRLICASHSASTRPGREQMLCRNALDRESKAKHGSLSIEHRRANGDAAVSHLTGNGYKDVFNGVHQFQEGFHPCRSNIDATFPLWMVGKEAFVHHAGNVRLTSEYLNMAKLDDIPVVLRIAKDAIGINKDDILKTSLLELAFDHAFRVRAVLPRSIKQRKELAQEQSPEWWERFHQMMLTGIYDGLKPIYDFLFNLDLSSSSVWDDETIKRLDLLCREIEASPFYNPNGLTLPRGSSYHGSAPWLWNVLHKFDDLNWEYLGRLFATRFKRMDDDCDFANDHDNECAETVFLTCIILWFRSDGKDEILGLHMTVFSRHALRFSIGRALHVEPGSIMRTGWTQKHPDSLSQYKEALRTITMETWFMNRAKFHYPVTPDNINLFKTLLRDISLDTPGWAGYPAQYTTANLQFPRSCRKNRSRPLDPESDISREDEEEVASEIGENLLDNEDLAMGFVFGGEVDDDDEGLEEVLSEDGSGEEEEEHNEQGETRAGRGHGYGSTGRAGNDEDLLNADLNYLFDRQKYIPANERARYIGAIMRLAHNRMSGTTSTTAAAPSRLELFKQAIITWATEQGTGLDMTMEDLAQTTLGSWQALDPRINAEFTLEEITAFCAELDDEDNFMYHEADGVLRYKP